MRILIVTRLFPPTNSIGAIRPYNFCKYLAQAGHEVICITEKTSLLLSQNHEYDYGFKVLQVTGRYMYTHSRHTSTLDTGRGKEGNQNIGNKLALIRTLRRTAAQGLHVINEITWAKKASKIAIETIKNEKPHCVLTTFGPLASVLIGLNIKKQYAKLLWISDMRDPMNTYTQQIWRRALYQLIQIKMISRADLITTVSDELAEMYRFLETKHHHSTPIYTIENGFEPLENAECRKTDGDLKIGYTGSLYNGLRKIDVLFQVIQQIEEEEKIKLPIKFYYCGTDGDEIKKKAKMYQVENHVINYGVLPKEKSLELQENCDVLCVLSWNTKHEKGVLTGKFAEYIRLRKPILTIVSGDIPNSELSARNDKLAVGFSFEYIREDDFLKLRVWLTDMMDRKAKGLKMPTISENEAQPYSYPEIVKKLEMEIINKCSG